MPESAPPYLREVGMIIKLAKPHKYEDKEIEEIDLDFDKATTSALVRADKRLASMKHVPLVKQMDTTYCLLVASFICGIPFQSLEALPLSEGNRVATMVSGFLLGSSEEEMTDAI